MSLLPRFITFLAHATVMLDRPARQMVEQLGVRRRFAEPAEVVGRGDDPRAEDPLPDAVHIDASREHRPPPFDLLGRVADQCLMPVTYGGGLAVLDDVRRVLSLGFEKVVINTAVETAPSLMRETADLFGSQALVASIDARSTGSRHSVTPSIPR